MSPDTEYSAADSTRIVIIPIYCAVSFNERTLCWWYRSRAAISEVQMMFRLTVSDQ